METTCVHYSREYVGHPSVVAPDRDHCVVADGTGHLLLINLPAQDVRARLFVGIVGGGASCNLRSLRRHPAKPMGVAAATRGGYAVIGDLDRRAVAKVHPAQGGTVNAVAVSPDGRYLAIGTGAYSPSGVPQSAHVELWLLAGEETPEYAGFAALPGACVDAIAWNPNGDTIACATGLRSQKPGFIGQLDAEDLRPQSFFETPWSGAGRLSYVDGESSCSHLAVIFKGGFRVLGTRDGKESWRVDRPEAPEHLQDFAIVPQDRQIALTSGVVLDALDGTEKSRFLAMKDCTSIAARPGGGYVGASSRGRIYCWE
jgi:hypothetical protein